MMSKFILPKNKQTNKLATQSKLYEKIQPYGACYMNKAHIIHVTSSGNRNKFRQDNVVLQLK